MRNRTALLVVDVQLGAFDGERCPVISGSDQLLANIAHLIEAARTSKTDVVFIQHGAPAGEVFEEGTAQWQIHPAIELDGQYMGIGYVDPDGSENCNGCGFVA